MNITSTLGLKPWALAGLGCGAIIVAGGVWTAARRAPDPQWLRQVDALPRYVRTANDRCTDADAAQIEFIEQDLLRRPMWDVAEARQLIDIILAGYAKPSRDPDQTREERSKSIVFNAAMLAIGTRLAFAAPITAPARCLLIDALVAELEAPFPERRVNAAVELIQLGEIEDRTVRAAVERLIDDPDPITAEDVAFVLTRYDDDQARRRKHAAR